MSRQTRPGTIAQPGTSVFQPEWYAQLYPAAPFDCAYVAGFVDIPGGYLKDGVSLRQMTVSGSGTPVTTAISAVLGQKAFRFGGGQNIATGHPSSDEFTLITAVNVTADQLAGVPAVSKVMFHTETGGTRQKLLQFSAGGALVLQIAPTKTVTVANGLLAGPAVIMATCRKLAADSYRASIYVNDFVTPKASADLAATVGAGLPWFIGGDDSPALPWTSDMAAFVIANRDLTKEASDYAAIKAALPLALAWATPA